MHRTTRHLALLLFAAAALASAGCKRADQKKIDDLEKRVAQLETAQRQFAEVEEFVRPVMAAQQEDAERRASQEADPNATFAVNVEGDNYHGPATAAVTIVEAWDFA